METALHDRSPSSVGNVVPPVLPPKLSQYTNYREFLRDHYNFKRQLHRKDVRAYSYAMFAAAADIRSPNYLKLVIEGDRNLSQAMAYKFANAMGLNKQDADEFWLLVKFNQELDALERNQHLKALNEFRVQRQLNQGDIREESWEKVPNWLAWVLRAMVDQEGVEFTSRKLHELLSGEVKLSFVEQALKKLISSGEISVDQQTLQAAKSQTAPEVGEDVPIELVRKIQSELNYLGLESLFRDSSEEREFGSATLALTESEFQQLRFELRQLRKRWHREIASRRQTFKGERIYQLNVQLFPVTKSSKEKRRRVDR